MKTLILLSSFSILAVLIYFSTQWDDDAVPKENSSDQSKATRILSDRSASEVKRGKAKHPQDIENNIQAEWKAENFDAVNDSFGNWIEFDPDGALSYVARMEYPMEPLQFSSEIKAYLETLSPGQAMTQSLKLSNDHNLQESVTADLFTKWLKDDFKSSQAWLLENSEQPFVPALAERMGRLGNLGKPEEALEWIVKIPEGELRSKLVMGVVLRWLRVDPDMAIEYLNTLPPSPAFDEMAVNYANELSEEDPVAAMMWANTIESESLRTIVVSQIKWGWNENYEREYRVLLEE